MRTLLRAPVTFGTILVVAAMTLSAPASAGSETKDGAKLVCKREAKTGTRFPKKTCHTRAQWDQIAEQNKRDAQEMINRPIIETRRE